MSEKISSTDNAPDQKSKNRQTLKRILRHIRPYLGYVILSLLLSAFTVALTLYVPFLRGGAWTPLPEKELWILTPSWPSFLLS